MADEYETVELEISEDDILYYLVSEDGEEIGFVIEEDGQEVECYYEGFDADDFEIVDSEDEEFAAERVEADLDGLAELDGEIVEMEIDEESIDHYIFDEQGNEIGFAIVEGDTIVECYYSDDEDDDDGAEAEDEDFLDEHVAAAEPETESEPKEHGYLYKMASIAGYQGNKARKRATEELGKARAKAEPALDKARAKAEAGVDKATEAVESGGKKIKDAKDEYDLGITREDISQTTADLNAIAKEGAETAKELKEAYDDIMDSFGFLVPKKVRRKLP